MTKLILQNPRGNVVRASIESVSDSSGYVVLYVSLRFSWGPSIIHDCYRSVRAAKTAFTQNVLGGKNIWKEEKN